MQFCPPAVEGRFYFALSRELFPPFGSPPHAAGRRIQRPNGHSVTLLPLSLPPEVSAGLGWPPGPSRLPALPLIQPNGAAGSDRIEVFCFFQTNISSNVYATHILRTILYFDILYWKGSGSVPTSEAQKRATAKHLKVYYKELRFRVKKEQADKIEQRAISLGLSFRAYVLGLIEKDMKEM